MTINIKRSAQPGSGTKFTVENVGEGAAFVLKVHETLSNPRIYIKPRLNYRSLYRMPPTVRDNILNGPTLGVWNISKQRVARLDKDMEVTLIDLDIEWRKQ